MEKALQICFTGVEHSDSVQEAIEERVSKIEDHHDFVNSCKVVVDRPHKHHHKGNIYRIGIEMNVPNDVISINHVKADHLDHENVYIAVRDAFDIADRQLRKVSNRKKRENRVASLLKSPQ